jgi:S-adenosylmethionine hydrolase
VTHFRYLSFLTDYGLEDGFVAACHGVSARIAPHADIIDVTHLIPPGDVRRGAAVLAQTVPYLPPAVHVAVVDPGVGTARRGEVLTVDRFGNVQLSITGADAAQIGVKPGGTVLVQLGHRQLTLPYRETFGAVATGELVTYTDSAGLISVAVNGGNAAQRLGLRPARGYPLRLYAR